MKEIIFCGERMKALRNKSHITQDNLAQTIEVTRVQIANLEGGNSEPSVRVLVALAIALDCTTDYLLGVSSKRFGNIEKIEPLPFDD